MVTGTNVTQPPIPQFLTGRMHSQPNHRRRESTHNTLVDATMQEPEPDNSEATRDPKNRIADVMVNLQNKSKSLTVRQTRDICQEES